MNIGIFGSPYPEEKQGLIAHVFEKLVELDVGIYVEADFQRFLDTSAGLGFPVKGLLGKGDFDIEVALSLGGDGTFLRTAARVGRQNIPILGLNTGRLGFLADLNADELDGMFEELCRGEYRIEERSLLQLEAEGGEKEETVGTYNYALNEVAVLKRDTSSMLTIHVSIDGELLATYRADGLIVATPTGSTAYSMSVGGPILVPQSESLLLSPVAPHSLTVRPLVIPDNSKISLRVESRSAYFLVALDGRALVFRTDTPFSIRRADYTTRLIKRQGHTFYKTLRDKLLWGIDIRP
ncbi:MAG: NAD kinase [Tannerella sp.]|jgi:NAD+ kinase|nr:NAD kinase [Tannerella sp.]